MPPQSTEAHNWCESMLSRSMWPICLNSGGLPRQISMVDYKYEQPILPAEYQAARANRPWRNWLAVSHRRHHHGGLQVVAGLDFCGGGIICHLRGVRRLVSGPCLWHQDKGLIPAAT